MRSNRLAGAFALATLTMTAGAAWAQSGPTVRGVVEKIDPASERISIHHEAIPNLSMDGDMTMIFRAGDKAMLSSVRVGEKVRFSAERVNGQITLTRIEKAK